MIKNKNLSAASGLILGSILIGWGFVYPRIASALPLGQPIAPKPSATHSAAKNDDKSNTPERSLSAVELLRRNSTVQVITPDLHGSGVIIAAPADGYWVVTNRHVVAGAEFACVATFSGARYPGVVRLPSSPNIDLAFVWFPLAVHPFPVATLALDSPKDAIDNVISNGFAYPGNQYTESSGLTIPLLDRTIESGYRLVYSNVVTKGMSGGGVFSSDGLLIGINAIHSDPLWPVNWLDSSGKPLSPALMAKLDAASVGIASDLIAREFATHSSPAAGKVDPGICSKVDSSK